MTFGHQTTQPHSCLTEANLMLIFWGQLCICAIQIYFCIPAGGNGYLEHTHCTNCISFSTFVHALLILRYCTVCSSKSNALQQLNQCFSNSSAGTTVKIFHNHCFCFCDWNFSTANKFHYFSKRGSSRWVRWSSLQWGLQVQWATIEEKNCI